MKTITIILLTATLFSCSKEKTSKDVCWTCKYSAVNTRTYPDYNECNAGEDPKPPKMDAAGNELSWYCTKK